MLLEAGPHVTQAATSGRNGSRGVLTPLYAAVQSGEVEVVRVLVKAGADVNQATKVGPRMTTPLLLAAAEGDVAVVRALVEAGADVNHPAGGSSMCGETPLFVAALLSHVRVVRALLKAGADVHQAVCRTYPRRSKPINVATDEQLVRALVEAGAAYDPQCIGSARGQGWHNEGEGPRVSQQGWHNEEETEDDYEDEDEEEICCRLCGGSSSFYVARDRDTYFAARTMASYPWAWSNPKP